MGLKGDASIPTDDVINGRNQHSMAFEIPIPIYKGSFFPQKKGLEFFPQKKGLGIGMSFLILSSSEDAEDCVA